LGISAVGIDFYKSGIKCRILVDDEKNQTKNVERSIITDFSKKSRKRLSWVYSQGPWKSMFTVTYHKKFPDFKVSKSHLNSFLQACRRMNLKYLWVAEWQGRGFPHYHIWLSDELTEEQRHTLGCAWISITSEYNDTEESKLFHLHERVYTSWNVQLNLNYASKYAQKMNQKWLPLGVERFGRWWGASRGIIFSEKSVEYLNSPENVIGLNDFRRNVRRCIAHWSRKKGKKKKSGRTNSGFTYVLNDHRKQCVVRLYNDMLLNLDESLVNRCNFSVDSLPF